MHPQLNIEDAKRHATLLAGDGAVLLAIIEGGRVEHRLGAIADLWPLVVARPAAHIYITMNETSGDRRRRVDVIRVRAVWVDDDTPGPRRTDWQLEPSYVVESSPGRFHYVWLTDHDNLDDFDAVMRGMPGDPAARDAARVLRLAGTWNQKRGARAEIVACSGRRYTWTEIETKFPPVVVEKKAPSLHEREPERADSALRAIPNTGAKRLGEDAWCDLGMAHQSAGGTLEAFVEWTAHPEKERETRSRWLSFTSDGGIGPGTLYKEAQANGWIDPTAPGGEAAIEALAVLESADQIGQAQAAQEAAQLLARISMSPSVAAAAVERVRAATGVEVSPYNADGFEDLGSGNQWLDRVSRWTPPLDLLTRTTDVPWAVEGWIQQGKVGALVAGGGTGKTTLLLVLGICIALGRPWFGRPVRRGSFLLLSNDDPQDDLDAAFALIIRAQNLTPDETRTVLQKVRVVSGIGAGGCKTFTVTEGGTVTGTGLGKQLQAATRDIDDLVVVALDTLRQFSGGSTNDEQVIKLTIADATEFAYARNATVILPHHTGKQNYRDKVDDMYAGSGSAAIADNCRFVLLLQTATWTEVEAEIKVERRGGNPLVLTSTRGSLRVKKPDPMFLYRQDYLIDRVEGHVLTRDEKSNEAELAILRTLRAGPASGRTIQGVVGGTRFHVTTRLKEMVARGLITPTPHALTDLGSNHLGDVTSPRACEAF